MNRLPENTYERESKELLTVTIQKNRLAITEGVFLCVIDSDQRPLESEWVPAIITADNKCGILIENLLVGTYSTWVKVVDAPEAAVFRVGTVRII